MCLKMSGKIEPLLSVGSFVVLLFFLFIYLIFGSIIFIEFQFTNPNLLGGIFGAIIIYLIIPLIIFVILRLISTDFCDACQKRIHPILKEHICIIDAKDKIRKLNILILNAITPELKSIKNILKNLSKLNIFANKDEKEILKENLISLRIFEVIQNYKYTMIAMGSILEFLLIRYCKINNISPEAYTDPLGNVVLANNKTFANYVQSAILHNIFGQKNSWLIVQNNLRNFRNYVHIKKEIKEETIDENWYITIKPVFERIIENLK